MPTSLEKLTFTARKALETYFSISATGMLVSKTGAVMIFCNSRRRVKCSEFCAPEIVYGG